MFTDTYPQNTMTTEASREKKTTEKRGKLERMRTRKRTDGLQKERNYTQSRSLKLNDDQ